MRFYQGSWCVRRLSVIKVVCLLESVWYFKDFNWYNHWRPRRLPHLNKKSWDCSFPISNLHCNWKQVLTWSSKFWYCTSENFFGLPSWWPVDRWKPVSMLRFRSGRRIPFFYYGYDDRFYVNMDNKIVYFEIWLPKILKISMLIPSPVTIKGRRRQFSKRLTNATTELDRYLKKLKWSKVLQWYNEHFYL